MGDADRAYQQKIDREKTRVWTLCVGGWEKLIEAVGGELTGLSAKPSGGGVLLVIKANFEGKAMVCFTSALDLASAMVLAASAIDGNTAKWRPDSFAKPVFAQ